MGKKYLSVSISNTIPNLHYALMYDTERLLIIILVQQ